MKRAAWALAGLAAGLAGCTGEAPAGGDDCGGNGDCDPGLVCVDGHCVTACVRDQECPALSDACVDGICVEVPNADCDADDDCDTPPGDHPDCFTPACVGGRCAYEPLPSRACEPLRCLDGFVYFAQTCGAAGTCPTATPPGTSCGGYACADATTCRTACNSGADCAPGLACRPDNTCEAPRADGEACTAAGTCQSGSCVDATCCAGPCDGTCQRCDALGGAAGACHAAPAGQDPDDDCADGPLVCTTGSCDGTAAACELVPAGTSCGECRACDAAGACLTNSTDHDDCGACRACADGACVPVAEGSDPRGECEGDGLCGSGACDGAGACDLRDPGSDCGTCRTCDGAGTCQANSTDHGDCPACQQCEAGACVFAAADQDPKEQCNPDAGCGDGFCNGGGACTFAAPGTTCGACRTCDAGGSCSVTSPDGAACGGGTCGRCAVGSCAADDALCAGSCARCDDGGGAGPYTCVGDEAQCDVCEACLGFACDPVPAGASDPDTCAAPRSCDGAGTCVGRPDGATGCVSGVDCASGNCDTSAAPGAETGRCCLPHNSWNNTTTGLVPFTGGVHCCDQDADCGAGNHCRDSTFQCVAGSAGAACDTTADCDAGLNSCCDMDLGTAPCVATGGDCRCYASACP